MVALVVLVATVGVAVTLFSLWRAMAAVRAGAPRELVLGWMALMIAAGAGTMVLLRVV